MSAPPVPYPKALKMYPTIRQSVLSSFDNCALLVRFEREHRGGWNFPWQARGGMFHSFAARALTEMYRQSEESIEVDVALAILHEVLRQADVDKECPHCGSTKIRRGLTKAGNRYCLSCRQRFETEIVVLPEREVEDLYWIVKKWAHDNQWSISDLVDVEQRLQADITYPNPARGAGRAHAHRQARRAVHRGRARRPRHRLRLEGHLGDAAADRGQLRGILPAAVLRLARDAQLPRGRAGDPARVLRALLGAARGDAQPRADGRPGGGDGALVERFDRSIEEHLYSPRRGSTATSVRPRSAARSRPTRAATGPSRRPSRPSLPPRPSSSRSRRSSAAEARWRRGRARTGRCRSRTRRAAG